MPDAEQVTQATIGGNPIANPSDFVAVVAGREPDGWSETDEGDVRMVMAALRQVVAEALHQNVAVEQIFTEVGIASARRSEALRKVEKEHRRIARVFEVKFGRGDMQGMLRYSRRMSSTQRLRYRLFLGGSISL